jgi:hypothetical protein
MQLQSLCPQEGADLNQLSHLLEGRGWQSGLPGVWSDVLLLKLARDFRRVEAGVTSDRHSDEDESTLAVAMYVTMNLLLQHPAHRVPISALDVSEAGLLHALQIYQWGLEREVVRRIVGIEPDASARTESLMDGLWRCLQE